MWRVLDGNSIEMAVGDFGISLPITVSGATIAAGDEMRMTVRATTGNQGVVLTKTFSNILQNTIHLVLTETESALLPPGRYVYALDWYKNSVFLCNVIPRSYLIVEEKA